jgi:hypothetical protein
MMNMDAATVSGYAIAAAGGLALGVLAGRRMLTEMRSAISAVQMRLSALEQKAMGLGASTTVPHHAPAAALVHAENPAASGVAAPAASHAAALDHHASAVEKLAAAIEKHAQAVDDHGAATVAAAVEMGSHPAVTPVAASLPHASGPLATVHPSGGLALANAVPAAASTVAAQG